MISWIKKIKIITWDLDGTLYPANPDFSKEIERKKIEAVALHLDCSAIEAQKNFDAEYSTIKSHTKTLDALGIDGSNFFIELWREIALNQYIQKNPDLVSTFRQLAPLPQAILTNSNSKESIKEKLNLIGLDSSDFSFIMSSVDAGYIKPDPRIFKALIQKAQTLSTAPISPEEILYVGDREKVDIIPAKEQGIRTCIVGKTSRIADLSATDAEEVCGYFL